MTASKSIRIIAGALAVAALLAVPATASAQSKTSTFIIALDRTGTPGTETKPVIDPVTGLQVIDPATGQPMFTTIATGAFVNPCTAENVDVLGSTTISVTTSTDKFGHVKVVVSESTKATGSGWVILGVPTGNLYSFADSQQFSTTTLLGDVESSDFADKFTMRGKSSLDNWIIRAHFALTIDQFGNATVSLKGMNTDGVCKG